MALLIVIFFSPIIFRSSVGMIVFGGDCANPEAKGGNGICGILASGDLQGYWPNVVQLMFFTVLFNLGDTVCAAWQGMAGTFVVGINQVFMAALFPVGGKCDDEPGSHGDRLFGVSYGLRVKCNNFHDPNYASMQWFVWLDVILGIVVILMSNANESTMKFALSWHVAYMMAFMSPGGFSASHAVNVTSFFAIVLAMVTVLFCGKDFRTIDDIKEVPSTYKKNLRELFGVLSEFLHVSPTSTNFRRTAVKFDIEHRINELADAYNAMDAQYKSTWWEMIIFWGSRQQRSTLWVFKTCLQDFYGFTTSFNVMKKAILAEMSDKYFALSQAELKETIEERNLFLDPKLGKVSAMNHAVCDLVDQLEENCKNTNPEKEELELMQSKLRARAQEVRLKKEELEDFGQKNGLFITEKMYGKISEINLEGKSTARRHLRNNLMIYIYGCLVIAHNAMQWADGENDLWKKHALQEKNNKRHAHTQAQLPVAIVEVLKQVVIENGLLETFGTLNNERGIPVGEKIAASTGGKYWRPCFSVLFTDRDKFTFVWTNALAITLTFMLGNALDGGVWTPYSAGMAGTLGVLITHSAGSAVYRNLMRLLGIVLGKVIPIMLIAIVVLFAPSGSHMEGGMEAVVHSLVLFGYMAFFANVYYTSPQWGTVGCLCAGFGCYAFVDPTFNNDMFKDRYKEIGSVTFAIFLQIAIDGTEQALSMKWPRDQVVKNMRQMGCGTDMKKTGKQGQQKYFGAHFIKVFTRLFDADDDTMLRKAGAHANTVSGIMSGQAALVDDCDDKTLVLAARRAPFHLELYQKCLGILERLKTEVEILVMIKYYRTKGADNALAGKSEWAAKKTEIEDQQSNILTSLPATFSRMQNIFEMVGTDTLVEEQRLEQQRDDGSSRYKDTMNLSLCVTRRTLNDVRAILTELDHTCFASGFLKTDFEMP